MGFYNKMMDFFSIGGDDDDNEADIYDDFDDEVDYNEFEDVPEEPAPRSSRESRAPKRRESNVGQGYSDNAYSNSSRQSSRRSVVTRSKNTGKVVSLRTDGNNSTEFEIETQRPNNFNDSTKICDIIKDGKPVLVNLEGLNDGDAQRIVDIVSGCVYAMNGSVCNGSPYVLLFAPGNVEISGDLVDGNGFGDQAFRSNRNTGNW